MSGSVAFFDLDRTLLRCSSVLALAGSFRQVGIPFVLGAGAAVRAVRKRAA